MYHRAMPPTELAHIAASLKRWLPLAQITLVFLAFGAFFRTAYQLIDPDLWWRIHSGMDILASGSLPYADSWTWTLPGHPWIEYEWFIDTLYYVGVANGAWIVLAIAFAAFALIPFAVWTLRARNFLDLSLVAIGIYLMLPIVGVRPQIVTVTLFFLLYEFLRARGDRAPDARWTLGAATFFALWANLHPGFFTGFALWGLWFLGGIWEDRLRLREHFERHAREALALGIAFLATFLNPYAHHIHLETLLALASDPMHTYIAEWRPPFQYFEPLMPTLVGVAIFLVWKFRTAVRARELLILAFFFVSFVKAARMAPMFLITLLPVLLPMATRARTEITKIWAAYPPDLGMIRTLLFGAFAAGAFVIVQIASFAALMGAIPYPQGLAAFYESHRIEYAGMRILHPYEWGGYFGIARNAPRVYIDGRMPHWMLPSGDSLLLHSVGFEIGTVAEQREAIKQLCVEGVVLQKPDALLSRSLFPIFLALSRDDGRARRIENIERLQAQGWRATYEDDTTILFVAPEDWFTRFPCADDRLLSEKA